MTQIKRILITAIIAFTIFINAHKPSDHEQVAESPTANEPEIEEIPTVVPTENRPEVAEINEQAVEPEPIAETKPDEHAPTTRTFEATFYTAGCDGCNGITASGVDVRNTTHYKGYRVIAADKSVPFGTVMRITLADGTQFDGIVQDRGGAIKGARLDVLVASKAEAYRLGRQQVNVEIIGAQ